MIEDALALAARVAPCILTEEFQFAGAARAILRGAILRWNEAGTGALQSERLEDYQYTTDTRYPASRGLFFPSEISQLQDLCRGEVDGGAFAVGTIGVQRSMHADICSLNFGALYCSCGAVLTMDLPLYENL